MPNTPLLQNIVQSVIVPKSKYTKTEAEQWVRKKGFKIDKIDETENFYRFRQHNPRKYSYYITKTLRSGIKLIIDSK